MVAVPSRPPAVAVITALPGDMPITRPDDETVATDSALDVHVTGSSSGPPAESTAMAVSCVDCPSTMLSRTGVTRTADTGTRATDTPTVALLDSLCAVIVATPGDTPVSKPDTSTPTIRGSLVLQNTGRPVNTLPASSSVRAESCKNPPTNSAAAVGVSCTLATARVVTTTRAVALRPSILAAMVADPLRTAVTTPTDDTRATLESLLDHATRRSTTARLASSSAVACNATVFPSLSTNCSSESVTVATGVSSGRGPVRSPTPRHALMTPVHAIKRSPRQSARRDPPKNTRDILATGQRYSSRACAVISRAVS